MKNVVKIKNPSFAKKVRDVVRGIPRGKVLSYAQVAILADFPGAARAVGTVMKHNFDETVPCHRVVKSTGEVGEYNRGGSEEKIKLLKREGIEFLADGRIFVR